MSTSAFKVVDGKQVEKILEQGQKLRNAMLETILKNDPFTTAVMPRKHYTTPFTSSDDVLNSGNIKNFDYDENNPERKQIIEAYLKGDFLTKDQERVALKTLQSMSGVELSNATEKTFLSKNTSAKTTCFANNTRFTSVENSISKPCFCLTCKAYKGTNLDCDLRRPLSHNMLKDNSDKNCNFQSFEILKYVDSLKISLHKISLNEIGNKNLTTELFRQGVGENYFIEYHLPSSLIGNLSKHKSKVDSGLDNNSVRICSRRSGQSINFNHTFVHDIANLEEQNLGNVEIIFKVSYRSPRQKLAQILGFAKFKFDSFSDSKTLSCSKALAIHFKNEDCPIIVGSLKITAQFGCGKLYFGKDFVEAITCDHVDETLDSTSNSDVEKAKFKVCLKTKENKETLVRQAQLLSNQKSLTNKHSGIVQNKRPFVSKCSDNPKEGTYFESENKENTGTESTEKRLLFGFIYISEAQFLNQCPSSYISCQPFCQNETSTSRLVADSSHPLYNFCQKVPLLYENDLLLQLRENLTVLEFWERKEQTDSLFAITKLPLHQFYLAYRNAVLLQYLSKNKLPIIGTDWWEPIYSIENEELIGQVQILTALGTEQQIENLESERGFKNDIVKAKYLKLPVNKARLESIGTSSSSWRDRVKVNKKSENFNFPTKSIRNYMPVDFPTKLHKNTPDLNIWRSRSPSRLEFTKLHKVDVGVQSDLNLEKMENNKSNDSKSNDGMISSFLKILEQQRQQRTTVMESATNTDNPSLTTTTENKHPTILEDKDKEDLVNSNVRKTSDLLDTLQKALSIDPNGAAPKISPNIFKAHIGIKSANHLPSKKKIKAKKSKNRGKCQEESILPSTYVTFETLPGDPIKITAVVPKSTSPQWNYECDVSLPTELLTNGQKRLIFKVWKKTNNVVLQPNMQTDTVLGFAALDLSVLAAGLPNVQGWFNIVDFSGACHGQINIHATPLDNLNRFRKKHKHQSIPIDPADPDEHEEGDLLGRALKRKFTELDEITQRLRLRLSEVVNPESENENDEVANEFERDIDSLCIEEDFDMVNFDEEAKKLNANIAKSKSDLNTLLSVQTEPCSSKEQSNSESSLIKLYGPLDSSALPPSDKQLANGKQRIDTLLEKLSLLSAENAEAFSSRYVSGCSVSNQNLDLDTEHLLKDLDRDSRPNITFCSNLNQFQKVYGETLQSQSEISTDKSEVNLLKCSGSESSSAKNFSEGGRSNPDGQGNLTDEKTSS